MDNMVDFCDDDLYYPIDDDPFLKMLVQGDCEAIPPPTTSTPHQNNQPNQLPHNTITTNPTMQQTPLHVGPSMKRRWENEGRPKMTGQAETLSGGPETSNTAIKSRKSEDILIDLTKPLPVSETNNAKFPAVSSVNLRADIMEQIGPILTSNSFNQPGSVCANSRNAFTGFGNSAVFNDCAPMAAVSGSANFGIGIPTTTHFDGATAATPQIPGVALNVGNPSQYPQWNFPLNAQNNFMTDQSQQTINFNQLARASCSAASTCQEFNSFFTPNNTPLNTVSNSTNLTTASCNPPSQSDANCLQTLITTTHAQSSQGAVNNAGNLTSPPEFSPPQSVYDTDTSSPLSSASATLVDSTLSSGRKPASRRVQITSASSTNAFCEVLNPKMEYDKNQKKFLSPRRSEQRIHGGIVKLKISTKIPLGDSPLDVFVGREPVTALKHFSEHPSLYTKDRIQIPEVRTWQSEGTTTGNLSYFYGCELDLDSVFLTEDGKEVYRLVKSKGAINNRFHLWLILRYNNRYEEMIMPYEFVLKSGRTPAQQDQSRERDYASGGAKDACDPQSHIVSCRYLQAETARITNIHCETIQTENHDIAYFMRVRNDDDNVPSDLGKGDVVAFLEDEAGDTYIDFLTSENARKARLAGVISRTAFFRGRTAICDPDHMDCDLVCIIGEVEVKVIGEVRVGDLIYTSDCEVQRGTAVAKDPLQSEGNFYAEEGPRPTPTLLGMAMESYSGEDVKLVRCLVSIVLGISDLHQRRTLEELRQCNDKIVKLQRYLKGIWKKTLFFFVLFVIAGTVCFLFLAPNSPYLISKCEEGCLTKKGNCQYIKFDFNAHEAQEVDQIVGIRFQWKILKKKIDLHIHVCPNQTREFRYYLNKSRCVTGAIRAIASWLDPSPRVPRVNVFGVNKNCSEIYYHSARKGWIKYIKTEQIDHIQCYNS